MGIKAGDQKQRAALPVAIVSFAPVYSIDRVYSRHGGIHSWITVSSYRPTPGSMGPDPVSEGCFVSPLYRSSYILVG